MLAIYLDIKKRFREIEKKHLIIILSGIAVLIVLFLIALQRNTSVNNFNLAQDKNKSEILRKLNQIHETLLASAGNTNNADQKNTLQKLDKEVADIQRSISTVAKTNDLDKVSSQLLSIKTDVDMQMSDIKKSLSGAGQTKQYLDPGMLPFKVVTVDVISGQPYVSVDYDHHVFPLSMGDLLAGWRVVYADFSEGVAEFVNDKNQYIRINLQGEHA